jgi:hypothetical protein
VSLYNYLVKVDRIWHALSIKGVKLIVKYFISGHFIFGVGVILDLCKYISLADTLYLGGHLR